MLIRGALLYLRRHFLNPIIFLGILMLLFSGISGGTPIVLAQNEPPERVTWITVDSNSHDWLLARWTDNQIVCQINIDHEGAPTELEIQNICGDGVLNDWLTTPPCNVLPDQQGPCSGLFMQNTGSSFEKREIPVELPPPTVWVTVTGYVLPGTTNKWEGEPRLLLVGEEKLANERIIRISGDYAGTPFSCEGSECSLPLWRTGSQGFKLTFWAESSFGDKTDEYTALIRVLPWADMPADAPGSPSRSGVYVDIISSQWQAQEASTCAAIWQSFPSVNGPPAWLKSPADSTGLSTSLPLHFLAAQLIQNGVVDAMVCPNGGLEYFQAANQCGIEVARKEVNKWQNQFDEEIMLTSAETGIPALLLKNVFARESQLWPGIYRSVEEVGLGQLTEDGAEAALLWNPSFYTQFCPLVLYNATCNKGYGNLTITEQTTLRGALVQNADASCTDCENGIDLKQANFTVRIFGETIVGNCTQVNQMLYNLTGLSSGEVVSHDDLWRFTLINYNAGPGCLFHALTRTYDAGDPLDWLHVAANLAGGCRNGIDYVKAISNGDTDPITVFSTPLPTPTITPTLILVTARPVTSLTPTITTTPGTITPTPTLTPSPTPTATSGWGMP